MSSHDWAMKLVSLAPKDYDYDEDAIDDPKIVSEIIETLKLAPEVKIETLRDGDKHFMARWKGENGTMDEIADFFQRSDDGAIESFFVGSDDTGESAWIFG